MSKPREATVQIKALAFLRNHYAKSQSKSIDEIYCEKEKWTKKEFGGKRADGLICFEKDAKAYTVSLEAKSHRTLGALISSYNDEKFLLHSMAVSGLLTAITILSCIFYTELQWYLISVIGVVAFVACTFIAAAILDYLDLNNHRVVGVINQLKQYPANEQWVAYSKYTDNLLLNTPYNKKKNNLEILDKFCKDNRFGLIVFSNNNVEIKRLPVPKKGEFTHYYSKEKEIRKYLETAKAT